MNRLPVEMTQLIVEVNRKEPKMKTLEEAKVAATAAGIPPEDLTPEVLKRFGWEVEDILAGITINPAQTDQEVKEALVLLEEERKANNLLPHIAKAVFTITSRFFG